MYKVLSIFLVFFSFSILGQHEIKKGEYWVVKNRNIKQKNDTIPFEYIWFYDLNGSIWMEKQDSMIYSQCEINSDTLKLLYPNNYPYYHTIGSYQYLRYKKINNNTVILFIPISEAYVKELEYQIKYSITPQLPIRFY